MGAMIFARHAGQEKEYVFEVASKDAWPVNRGDFLIVDTMYGIHAAQATSDLVECQDVGLIAQKYGAYMPLRQVLRIIKKEDAEMLLTEFAMVKFDEAPKRKAPDENFLPY